MNDREKMLAEGPILKTMLVMGIPTFIAQLINILYNVVDRIYIGHIPGVGAAALTGVGLGLPLITFISAFAVLISGGGSPRAGIAFGKGDKEKAETIIANSVTLLLIFAVSLTVIFQLIKKPCLYLFGASDATYPYAAQYLTIYFCGTIFVLLSVGLNAYITVQGEARIAMCSTAIGAILNLILDPIFIFVFGWGVRGAALASVISQAVSAAWVLHFLTSKKAVLKIKTAYMKLKLHIILEIVTLGVSTFIMMVTESLIVIVFNYNAKKYGGDLYVGSITVLQSMVQLIITPTNGFSSGVSPIISYNFGAGNRERVKKVCYRLLLITGAGAMFMTACFMIFSAQISALFCNDPELVALCTKMLPVFISGVLLFGFQVGGQNCFMALGKAKQALFFALFRKVILLIPLAFILPKVMNSVMGVYYSEPISDIISAVCCVTVAFITIQSVTKETDKT